METLDAGVGLGRFALAFLFVVALILTIGWAAKRSGLQSRLMGQGKAGARLAIEETLMIDPRTKLVLVRRDDTRHLLLLGPQTASVVESNLPPIIKRDNGHA